MSDALTPEALRERIGHPVIDSDGHTTEFIPALAEYLKEVGISTDFNKLFKGVLGSVSDWYEMTPEERQRKHVTKPPPNPREKNPAISKETSNLILGMLEKKVENRPTPGQIANAIRTLTSKNKKRRTLLAQRRSASR